MRVPLAAPSEPPLTGASIQPAPLVADAFSQPPGDGRTDGRMVDDQLASVKFFHQATLTLDYLDHIGAVGDTDHDDIDGVGQVFEGVGHLCPLQRFRLGGRAIPHGQLMAFGDQVGGHAPSHDPDPDEPQAFAHSLARDVRVLLIGTPPYRLA